MAADDMEKFRARQIVGAHVPAMTDSILRICAHRSHANSAYFLCNQPQSSVLAGPGPATRHRTSAFPRRLREKFGCVAVSSHSLGANWSISSALHTADSFSDTWSTRIPIRANRL